MWTELVVAGLTLIVILVGAYARRVESTLDEKIKANEVDIKENRDKAEELEEKVRDHWEKDAKQYVLKKDFTDFAKDVKDSLIRIEEKIDRNRRT